MKMDSLIALFKKACALIILLVLIFTTGCGSSDKKPETRSYSTFNPLSEDILEGEKCANVVKILLDQKFYYKNNEVLQLQKSALLMMNGNPFPLNQIGEDFVSYSKYPLQSILRYKLMNYSNATHLIGASGARNSGLSYEKANEIASKFADLNELVEYDVTPSGKKIKYDDKEYHIINLNLKYPDLERINEKALENLSNDLGNKYEKSVDFDPKKIIFEKTDSCQFEKIEKLLSHYYVTKRVADTSKTTQRIEMENLIYDSYMKVLNDQKSLPYKTLMRKSV